ncbi:MAG: DUF1801 domain-containing protein [Steroidobacteraceae bacterium]|jgi:uncharacterized protein YdhG (YjbR/CyaY superfamily)
MPTQTIPKTVDEYIAGFAPDVQAILERIRQTVKTAAPAAEETISYRMPAFKLNGMLVYFAAFKKHIGLYPPVRGDDSLMKAVRPYAGPKGNLQFPFGKPVPCALIRRIVKVRVLAMREKVDFTRRSR